MQAEDGIAVTKYMEEYNDISVTKFMEAEDGIAVTKYLSGAPSYNTYPGQNDGSSNRNVNMTIIQFLDEYLW
jgi:hypothetical protein